MVSRAVITLPFPAQVPELHHEVVGAAVLLQEAEDLVHRVLGGRAPKNDTPVQLAELHDLTRLDPQPFPQALGDGDLSTLRNTGFHTHMIRNHILKIKPGNGQRRSPILPPVTGRRDGWKGRDPTSPP